LPAQKPKNAIDTLLDRVVKARKVLNDAGRAGYEIYAQSICSDFRKTLERVIEYDLLSDIVRRFSSDVQTKNKRHKLAKISPVDCKFLDDLMTQYSKYEHSQSYETPVSLPTPDQLRADFEEMNYPAVPKAFGTRYLISPLPRGEGMKGRVSKIIITKHPHPNPPPSMGRELFGNPDAEHRGIL